VWYVIFTVKWNEYNTIPFLAFISFHIKGLIDTYIETLREEKYA